jgi:outer membrane protein TolC
MQTLFKRVGCRGAAGALLLTGLCTAAWAQVSSATPPSVAHVYGTSIGKPPSTQPTPLPSAKAGQAPLTWQDANRAVAQFPRGHVDLLRWEQKNMPASQDAPAHPDAGQLTLALAQRLALLDEARWHKPGMSAQEAAVVRQQVAAVRRDVQKLWVDAVASRQSAAHSRDIWAVAQAASELGQRMAQVGNWSRARQIQEELPLWEARARLDKAQLQADRALYALWQRMGAGKTVQVLAQQLPLHLPAVLVVDVPVWALLDSAQVQIHGHGQVAHPLPDVAALQTQALQAHLRWPLEDLHARRLMAGLGLSDTDLQAAQKTLDAQSAQAVPVWDPRAMRGGHGLESALQARLQADRLARQVRADVQVALNAFQVARQNAQHTQTEVLGMHTELSQQSLLRYNGMLKSTWDLLASARTRIDSVDAALQAQRQAWLAHADLLAVLAGLPYPQSEPGGAGASGTFASTKTAGH